VPTTTKKTVPKKTKTTDSYSSLFLLLFLVQDWEILLQMKVLSPCFQAWEGRQGTGVCCSSVAFISK
jgi:hypothetical protein